MKTTRIDMGDFVAWRFQMDKGDEKHFVKEELVRGLTPLKPDTWPLNCISVYVKGSFTVFSDWKPVGRRVRGSLPQLFITESWNGCYNRADEDDSLYFCIYPKTKMQKYFAREIVCGRPAYVHQFPTYYFVMGDDGEIEYLRVMTGRTVTEEAWNERKGKLWCRAW